MKPTEPNKSYEYDTVTGRTKASGTGGENKGSGWWKIFENLGASFFYKDPGERDPAINTTTSVKLGLRYAAATGVDLDDPGVTADLQNILQRSAAAELKYLESPSHETFLELREAQHELHLYCNSDAVPRARHKDLPPTQEAAKIFDTQLEISLNQLRLRGVKIEDLSREDRQRYLDHARERALLFTLHRYESGHADDLTRSFHEEQKLLDELTNNNRW